MKLARTALFVICTNDRDCAGRNYRQPRRPNATHTFDIRRSSSRLAARWHVCPQTHRLECSWSFEAAASDDQLCRYTMLMRRRRTSRRLLIRRLDHNRPLLSQIRNQVRWRLNSAGWRRRTLNGTEPCHE